MPVFSWFGTSEVVDRFGFPRLSRVDEPTASAGNDLRSIYGTDDLGDIATPNQPTYYTYNVQGKMVRVQQGAQYRYFKYDSLGRLIRVMQPEQEPNANLALADSYNTSGQWSAAFVYNALGDLVRATDANGVSIINEYDKAKRVTKRCYSKPNINPNSLPTTCGGLGANASENTPEVTFLYDGLLELSQSPSSPNLAKGKLTRVSSSVSDTRYTQFDSLGRLTQMQQITDGTTYTSQYQYNFAGALVQETYPSGRVVRNEFESDGDLSRIWGIKDANAPERTYANSFSYTADGKIEKLKLGNNRWEWAKFNERLQVTELNLGAGVTDASLWKLTYHYGELNSDGRTVDAAKNTGNIAMQTVSFASLTEPFVQTYRYDSLYRITEARETNGATTNAAQNWKETFGYDRFGNRTNYAKFTGATQLTLDNKSFPTINPNTNRFDPNQGYLYDKNGNLISDAEGRNFVFNGENKQAKIIKDGNLVGEYDYNGEGQRVRKRSYDANGILQNTTVFVYSTGKLVAEYSTAAPPENPTTRYTATDMLGSPRVITDSEGNVIARRDFKPFGEEITNNTGERQTAANYGVADNLKQKFTTYQRDEESGLDFAEARMYENRHGRFTAVDPLLASGKSANPQTFNRFAYVLNNPVVLNDPLGLQAGRWMKPPSDTGTYKYVLWGKSIPVGSDGQEYVDVTLRNKRGDLIGFGCSSGEICDPNKVIRFNPNGPAWANNPLDLDDQFFNGPFVKNGWEMIFSDDYEATCIETPCDKRGVEDVSFEVVTALLGFAQIGNSVLRSGVGKAAMEAGASQLDDSAIVIRNGIPSADRFANGSGVIADESGVLSGVSVKSANGKTVEELVEGGAQSAVTRNGQIGVTTAGEIRSAGGRITPDLPANPANPFHCEITGLCATQLEMIFKQMPNPLKKQ